MAQEARAFGIDPETLPGARANSEGLWPEHLPALDAFLAISGQWRQGPDGHVLGLDYTAVRAGFALSGIEMTPDLWSDVQSIETGARAALNGKQQ
jgi:hypothetical protein